MANPFQEQFLKAGLVDGDRVKKAKAEKRKQAKQGKRGAGTEEVRRAAQKAAAEKAERDRRLNQQRKEEAARQDIAAQIRQMIAAHRQPVGEGEVAYNFVDGKKVRRVYVTETQRRQLVRGALGVVKMEGKYDLVPAEVAEKIRLRNERCFVALNAPGEEDTPDENDPYADYKVPDDLMW